MRFEPLIVLFCSECGVACGLPGMAYDCPQHPRAGWVRVEYVPASTATEEAQDG